MAGRGRWGRLVAVLALMIPIVQPGALGEETAGDLTSELTTARVQLDRAEEGLRHVNGQVAAANRALYRIGAKLRAANAELRGLEARLAGARAVERAATARTAAATHQLQAETARLQALQARLEDKQDDFEARVAATFKYGAVTYADALVEARSFHDFVSSLYYVRSALDYEDALINEVEGLVRRIAERRAEIDRLRDVALAQEDAATAARARAQKLAARQRAVTGRIAVDRRQRERILAGLRATKAQHEAIVASLEAESDALARELRAAQARAEAGRHLRAAGTPGRGRLVWPTNGGMTSGYGYRTHPVFGTPRMHTGIDISGATGQPVVAAAAGLVLQAGWRGGYGLTAVIGHGDGLATLYAHQSALAVTAGQWVEQAQHVGDVGSTGFSTGPHLHFEVRVNGEPRDPMDWY